MSRKHLKRVSSSINRVLSSEILPYELPITFSNRNFRQFCDQHNLRIQDGNIEWKKTDATTEAIIKLLLGFKPSRETIEEDYGPLKPGTKTILKPKNNNHGMFLRSMPFLFRIGHKSKAYRELAICHPIGQLNIVDIYRDCKELILYYSNKSSFSIRHPAKIATNFFFKDSTYRANKAKIPHAIEMTNSEYDAQRSFFTYEDYPFIHNFFESGRFHRCEKKYNHLLTLDVSNCFASIYTHSLAWAVYSKRSVKEDLGVLRATFANKFDTAMQYLNYNETNGIVIGPEFSRVFAELILQAVDKAVEEKLKEFGYQNRVHYEAFRYVDDYFVFYSEKNVRDTFCEELKVALSEHKLYLQTAKEEDHITKPIITGISIAKERISNLLSETVKKAKAREDELQSPEVSEDRDEDVQPRFRTYIASKLLITRFKIVIRETGVTYRDIMNFSLAKIERIQQQLLRQYEKSDQSNSSTDAVSRVILSLLEVAFFVYSVSPNVSSTVRLSRVLSQSISFCRSYGLGRDHKNLVFKCISDNCLLILRTNSKKSYSKIETIYLIIIMAELGKDYWLLEESLWKTFDLNNTSNPQVKPLRLDYFEITCILFYIRDKKRYSKTRTLLEEQILLHFPYSDSETLRNTESTLLLFDMISCPYINETVKREILTIVGVSDPIIQNEIINARKPWFTQWRNFDLQQSLDAKKGYEVY